MNYNINEQGRSMIEMLGVLAIVGVLSVGGIAGYSKAMNKFKVNKTIDQINMIATNIRTLYSSQRTYEGLNNIVAKKTGAIPAEMYTKESDSTITNAFGGAMMIAPGTQSDTANDSFIIAIDQIPPAACVSIATTEWGADSGSGLVAMVISSSGVSASASVGIAGLSRSISANRNESYIKGADYLPFSIVDASGNCAGTLKMMAWKYR
jgi:type II secretory pathway pseudopilin PulG